MLDGVVDRRHHRGNHDPLNARHAQPVIAEQIRHNDAILIGCHRRIRGTAPALEQAAALEDSGLDIRVANIHDKDHVLRPLS